MVAVSARNVLLVVSLLLPAGSASSSADTVTLAVGGFNSTGGSPGLFVTARLIDPDASVWTVSSSLDPAEYALVELRVYRRARRALENHKSVNLLGYSHGATLALRVVHRLHRDDLPLGRVKLITIDRIGVGYPLLPVFHSVPRGLALAYNVYQQDTLLFQGGRVRGATNTPVTGRLLRERQLGRTANPFDPRFKMHNHQFIEDSDLVRKLILKKFEIEYLPGIWDLRISVDHGADFSSRYVVYGPSGRFEAKAWTLLGEFISFSGHQDHGLAGEVAIPTYAEACPQLGVKFAVGYFMGGFSDNRNRIRLYLVGDWPTFYRSRCEYAGTAPFTGNVGGMRTNLSPNVGAIESRPSEVLEPYVEDPGGRSPSRRGTRPAHDGLAVPMTPLPVPPPSRE